MSILVEATNGPLVIDRRLPRGIFERAPDAVELVAAEDGDAREFPTAQEAEAFLREALDPPEIDAYEWRIIARCST